MDKTLKAEVEKVFAPTVVLLMLLKDIPQTIANRIL